MFLFTRCSFAPGEDNIVVCVRNWYTFNNFYSHEDIFGGSFVGGLSAHPGKLFRYHQPSLKDQIIDF